METKENMFKKPDNKERNAIDILNAENRNQSIGNDEFFQEVMEELDNNEKGSKPSSSQKSSSDYMSIYANKKGKYYVKKATKSSRAERISNFIIEPLYTVSNEYNNQQYYLKLVSKKYSKTITFDGETLAMNQSFMKHCMNNGMFHWSGKQKQLNDLVNMILSSTMKEILVYNYAGWNSKEEMWLFSTHAYHEGQVYFENDEGVIEINDKSYKVQIDKESDIFHPHCSKKPTACEVKSYFDNLYKLYRGYSILGLGYSVGSLIVDSIAEVTDFFPFVYAYGKMGQGKSFYMSTIAKFTGVKSNLEAPPTLDRLRKGLEKKSHTSHIIDEAENKEEQSKSMDFFKKLSEWIKLIYMRQPLIRGHKDEHKSVYYPVRATLMIGGEVLTDVTSIVQRSVLVDSSKIVQDENAMSALEKNEEIGYWIAQLLMKTSHDWKDEVIQKYREIQEFFSQKGWNNIHVRIRKNYAVFLAAASVGIQQINKYFDEEVICMDNLVEDIYQFVYNEMKETHRLTVQDHPSLQFLRKIGLLANRGNLQLNVDYDCVKTKDGQILLYLAPSNVMDSYLHYEKNPFYTTSHKVKKDLQSQTFFVGTKKHRIGKSQPTAWIIQLTDPNDPAKINEGIVHPDLPDTMIYFYNR